MDHYSVFPNERIVNNGPISGTFLGLGITDFNAACRYVHELPYGYNSDRDNLKILFNENMGSCTTKHAVISTLAAEMEIEIYKCIGIYAMTDALVTGTHKILELYGLPYVPMIHCFLVYNDNRVDLSEGNLNGKNRPIDDFLYTEKVAANISGKEEYLLYRKAVKDHILPRAELTGVDLRTILKAREEGLLLLRSIISQ